MLVLIVKLRSRSRLGEGQLRVRKKVRVRSESCELKRLKQKLRDLDLSNTLNLVFTLHPHKLFSWLLRGLDMSDGPRMGWYDSSRV